MSLLDAFLFGMTLGIAIGPIALLILNTALQSGWRAGLACAAGATTADLLFALVAFQLAHQLVPLLQAHATLLQWLASAVLCAFAGRMLWQLRRVPGSHDAPLRSGRRHYLTTLALTLVNPLTVLAFASYATQLATQQASVSATWLAVAAALGTGTVAVVLVCGAHGLRQLLTDPRWLFGLNAISAVGILLFALRGMWLAAQT